MFLLDQELVLVAGTLNLRRSGSLELLMLFAPMFWRMSAPP
jgi:hypothetical protein